MQRVASDDLLVSNAPRPGLCRRTTRNDAMSKRCQGNDLGPRSIRCAGLVYREKRSIARRKTTLLHCAISSMQTHRDPPNTRAAQRELPRRASLGSPIAPRKTCVSRTNRCMPNSFDLQALGPAHHALRISALARKLRSSFGTNPNTPPNRRVLHRFHKTNLHHAQRSNHRLPQVHHAATVRRHACKYLDRR